MKYYALFDENGYRVTSYVEGIHEIPKEAILITEDEQKLYQTNKYKRGKDGKPELIPEPEITLEEIKAFKWEEIKTLRDTEEQAGLPYMDKVLDSDTLSVQRLTIAVQTAQTAITLGQEFTIDWTCKDNSVLKMTAKKLIGVPPALAQFSDSLHQKARKLREQIDNAETIEEVENIKW